MPEIAESMASKEEEDDNDFNMDMQYVPHKVSQSQKIKQIEKNQSTPSPEKQMAGPRAEKVDEHPQKHPQTMTVETDQNYNSAKNRHIKSPKQAKANN